MLLTLRSELSAVDLGYVLHKNPARIHTFELPFGKAHVFYPEVGERAEAALLLDIDPVGLVRGKGKGRSDGVFEQYVNDRPYASSSFLSVALSRVFGSALAGRSRERPELTDQMLSWEATIATLFCRGGETVLRSLFEPLGYEVATRRHGLDERFPEWGESSYYDVVLSGKARLQDLLTHLYVLIPALDTDKHYWVGHDEVEKLLRKGEGWLAAHPQKEVIASRYLRYDRKLTRQALARLVDDDLPDPEGAEALHRREEQELEKSIQLWEQRIEAVVSALESSQAKSVADLGCGEGKLLKVLLKHRQFERVVGMDVSWRILEVAHRRLRLDSAPTATRDKVELLHGSLLYRDRRLAGFDAATALEVIEHLDPPRLAAFERVVFDEAQPRLVIVTTPNVEYNARFASLPAGQFRHKDHRFEWTRKEFSEWVRAIGSRFGYDVRWVAVGPEDDAVGSPTQMGVFSR